MTNKKTTKRSLLVSLLALMLCFSMLIGTTFAWFTDSTASTGNIIKSGTLDVKMSYSSDNATYTDVEADNAGPVFNYDKWEPGYTDMKYIKIENTGSLAFKWQLHILPNGTVDKLAEVIDVYVAEVTESFDYKLASYTKVGTLKDMIDENDGAAHGALLSKTTDATPDAYERKGSVTLCIALHMREDAGNEYMNMQIGSSFNLTLIATQYTEENDSFNDQFDKNAPLIHPNTIVISADITNDATVNLNNATGTINASVPAAAINNGYSKLQLLVTDADTHPSTLQIVANGQAVKSYEVKLDGLADNNTEKVSVTFAGVAPTALADDQLDVYHNGVKMDANDVIYDPASGNVTILTASFSTFDIVYNVPTPDRWDGTADESWGTPADDGIYYISTAEQLAQFAAMVNAGNEFEGKTVKLTDHINLNGNNWKPIGGQGRFFRGTFDGQYYTISDMRAVNNIANGNGLFGAVADATVKNLKLVNAHVSRYGVAQEAYRYQGNGYALVTGYSYGNSTFENVHIQDSEANGYGKVGAIVGHAAEASGTLTFNNCTVVNTIVYGAYNVAGLAGMVEHTAVLNNTYSFAQWSGGSSGFTYKTFNGETATDLDGKGAPIEVYGSYWYYAYGADVLWFAAWGQNYVDGSAFKYNYALEDGTYIYDGFCK